MMDLVRHPNLPVQIRDDILKQYDLFAGLHTIFNFAPQGNISEFDLSSIEAIVKNVIDEHSDLLTSTSCSVVLESHFLEIYVPLILVKQNVEIIGDSIEEALNSAGYEVGSWEYDEV